MEEKKIRKLVREGYSNIARAEKNNCGCSCGENVSENIGYTRNDLDSVPKGANLELGCGNPVALSNLKKGEIVVDLGSGGGLDCFLAAKKVGLEGKIIGIDMTAEMVDKARNNCKIGRYNNVEFRLGEIENLPVADNTADVIISNCVINLSPDKQRVFNESYRILKPGGRLLISDIVLQNNLPELIKQNVQAYIGCVSGSELKTKYIELIERAGFSQVKIISQTYFPIKQMLSSATSELLHEKLKNDFSKLNDSVISVKISAKKPKIQLKPNTSEQ